MTLWSIEYRKELKTVEVKTIFQATFKHGNLKSSVASLGNGLQLHPPCTLGLNQIIRPSCRWMSYAMLGVPQSPLKNFPTPAAMFSGQYGHFNKLIRLTTYVSDSRSFMCFLLSDPCTETPSITRLIVRWTTLTILVGLVPWMSFPNWPLDKRFIQAKLQVKETPNTKY